MAAVEQVRRHTNPDGYVVVYAPDHHSCQVFNERGIQKRRWVKEHILIAEKAVGHPLPEGVEVHHFNEIRSDNANTNLVVCQDRAYHFLLHRRRRVVQAGGNPDTQKICSDCAIPKLFSEFSSGGKRYDGLNQKCKACARGSEFKYMAKRVSLAGGNPETEKFCDQCKLLLLKTDFHKNPCKSDGLKSKCKKCSTEDYLKRDLIKNPLRLHGNEAKAHRDSLSTLRARQRIIDAGGDPGDDKICCTCKSLKARTDFGQGRNRSDGLSAVCRACKRQEHANKKPIQVEA